MDLKGFNAPEISSKLKSNPFLTGGGGLDRLESFINQKSDVMKGEERRVQGMVTQGAEDLTALDYLIAMNPLKTGLKEAGYDFTKYLPGFTQGGGGQGSSFFSSNYKMPDWQDLVYNRKK